MLSALVMAAGIALACLWGLHREPTIMDGVVRYVAVGVSGPPIVSIVSIGLFAFIRCAFLAMEWLAVDRAGHDCSFHRRNAADEEGFVEPWFRHWSDLPGRALRHATTARYEPVGGDAAPGGRPLSSAISFSRKLRYLPIRFSTTHISTDRSSARGLPNQYPRIISESIDDETIIIDFDSGAYFSARGVANRIWQWVLRSAHPDLPQMIEGIAAEYDGDPSLMKASLS
ncbi:MAG: hypothetical protein R2856_37590 [Caldilineaceae bacterium]